LGGGGGVFRNFLLKKKNILVVFYKLKTTIRARKSEHLKITAKKLVILSEGGHFNQKKKF
jgi:hypothetical protein